ncbi:uncharacterized protein LOC112195836 isoform X2 [Rosa chinensis]|uniref:uncharacterized protein LOC112195836 isoform X2 n=1 Tax=Rosa chinensis TaxID=74649 RepID=UPI001AD8B76C|nr:uncharacterized protein LOC112195836 isoform X2 [Rosa chinensis]
MLVLLVWRTNQVHHLSLEKQRREEVSLYDDVSEEPKVGEFIVKYPSSESPIFHKCSWRRDSRNDSDGVPRFPPLVIPKDAGADRNPLHSVTGLPPVPLNIIVGYAVPLIADAHERETRKREPGYDEVEYRNMMRSFLMSED